MKNTKALGCRLFGTIFLALLLLALPNPARAQANPCAPKGKQKSQNPCAANPCGPGGQRASAGGKAITVRGEVARVEPSSAKLVLKVEGKQLDLTLSKHSVVRAGAQVKRLADVKPGERVTVSYVESGKERMAWYIYLASAAAVGNPCAVNPCAARNPCAANPCAPKAKKGK